MDQAPVGALPLTLRTHDDAPYPCFVAYVVAGMNGSHRFIVSIRIKPNHVDLIVEATVSPENNDAGYG